MSRSVILWSLAAVAGVVLVAGVTYAASGLSTQAIGLSSEPLTAGDKLAPAATATPTPAATPRKAKRRKPRPHATPRPTAIPTPVATAAPTVDDHGSGVEPGDDSGGHGGRSPGGGGGGGSDD